MIPHSTNHSDILSIFNESALFFQSLLRINYPGVEKHRHFELFSSKRENPNYASCFDTFERIEPHQESFHPLHPLLEIKSAWAFDCLFTDWPIYYRAIFELYKKLGGKIFIKEVTQENIHILPTDIVFNCAEIFAPILLGETFNPVIFRGHLLHISGMPLLKDIEGRKISYNFTPDLSVYGSESTVDQDLYFYQRNDRWIFGGSRQKGTIDFEGNWRGEEVLEPKMHIDQRLFPEQILTINEEILNHTFGIDHLRTKSLEGKIGYRYMGNGEENLRIDAIEYHNKLIVNNYGHGGSGVTLSWGCAFRVLNILLDILRRPNFQTDRFTELLLKASEKSL